MSNPSEVTACSSRRRSGAESTQGSTIGEHALRLAIQIQRQLPRETPGWRIFRLLGRIVAACVFYDCVRNRRGKVRDVFGEYYQPSLELMLLKFCGNHWPCSFVDRSGRLCAGTRQGHGTEHQTVKGRMIGVGEYESNFSAESYEPEWICYLKTEINECQDEYRDSLDVEPLDISGRRIACKLHLEQINDFFTDLGSALPFKSHASCFGCLVEIPRHPLPCGHVLCDKCVRDHGNKGHNRIQLDFCPLHKLTSFEFPWEISYKPEQAGVRILCLDGGGMRGIVELEVLRAIEDALGGKIPIQSFFDLIVGTSTGGINALALGVKQWPVKYCISMFEKFCDQAFTEREFGGVWGLEKAALLKHGSRYKAKPLHNALQDTLGRSPLFGANGSLKTFRTKVAVTATSGDGKEAMIIANYNRPQNPADSQVLVRPEDPSIELEIWEAAAATSAAPFYFKPYIHPKTGQSYIDGALYHNNPVQVANRERKLLWPDVANKHPDLLLSVGTGQNLSEIEEEASRRRSPDRKGDNKTKAPLNKSSGIRRTFDNFGALYQRLDNILDAEQTWTEFESDMSDRNSDCPSPYVRFNLDLKRKPPPFDAKDQFEELRKDVNQRLSDPSAIALTKEIACSLVASSFYFKLADVVPRRGGKFTCTGHICCKFGEASSNLRALGEFLQRQSTPHFMPYFIIQESSMCTPDRGIKVKLTDRTISRLATYGMLKIPHIDIEVSNPIASTTIALVLESSRNCDKAQRYLISGFPRNLVQEVPCKPARPSPTKTSATTSATRGDMGANRSAEMRSRPAHPERPRTHESSRVSPLPSHLPPRLGYPIPPYQHPDHSRADSAFELPQQVRINTSPKRHSSYDQAARPPIVPSNRPLTYQQPSQGSQIPTYLIERAARQVQKDEERKLRKSSRGDERGRPKRLVKRKDTGEAFVEVG